MSKTTQEAMMVADSSPGDGEMIDNKENNLLKNVDAPLSDDPESKDRSRHDLAEINMSDNGKFDDKSRDSDSESNQESGRSKRKHRRRRGGKNHRKWKPYDKMSWSEKQELEEKETKRATQKREEAFLSGHPVAPYNTTQFLMEDHEAISPDLHPHNSKDSAESSDSSSDYYDNEEDQNEGFQHKNFLDTFNDIRKQELMGKSKEDLVRDYVELEMKLELLEELKHSKKGSNKRSKPSSDSSSYSSEDKDFSIAEYLKLKEENEGQQHMVATAPAIQQPRVYVEPRADCSLYIEGSIYTSQNLHGEKTISSTWRKNNHVQNNNLDC